jgi:hypothetical protein
MWNFKVRFRGRDVLVESLHFERACTFRHDTWEELLTMSRGIIDYLGTYHRPSSYHM